MSILWVILSVLVMISPFVLLFRLGGFSFRALQRRFGTIYGGLSNGQPALLGGREVLALSHLAGLPQPLRSSDPPLLKSGAWVELRLKDVVPTDKQEMSLAAVWLRESQGALQEVGVPAWLEGTELVFALPNDRADALAQQQLYLQSAIDLGGRLTRRATADGGLLGWARAHTDPAVRIIAADREESVSLRVGIIEDPAACQSTVDAAILGLIRQLGAQSDGLTALARGWLAREEAWLVESGMTVATALGGALEPEMRAASARLMATAHASRKAPDKATLSALWEASAVLDAESQGLLIEMLRMGELPLAARAARRLGEVGGVEAVPPLLAAIEQFTPRRWSQQGAEAIRAAGEAVERIQGKLPNAEVGAFTLSGSDETGGLALAEVEAGDISLVRPARREEQH